MKLDESFERIHVMRTVTFWKKMPRNGCLLLTCSIWKGNVVKCFSRLAHDFEFFFAVTFVFSCVFSLFQLRFCLMRLFSC